jgi:hypothetical protein
VSLAELVEAAGAPLSSTKGGTVTTILFRCSDHVPGASPQIYGFRGRQFPGKAGSFGRNLASAVTSKDVSSQMGLTSDVTICNAASGLVATS